MWFQEQGRTYIYNIDFKVFSSRNKYLVGGLEHLFVHILGRIIPTDEVIFFRGVGIPPTSDIMNDMGNIMGL